jgi:tripartite-type tricarboxylate transporter receptor subunit TctC
MPIAGRPKGMPDDVTQKLEDTLKTCPAKPDVKTSSGSATSPRSSSTGTG